MTACLFWLAAGSLCAVPAIHQARKKIAVRNNLIFFAGKIMKDRGTRKTGIYSGAGKGIPAFQNYADITESSLKGTRIALAEEGYLDFGNPEVASAVRQAASVFQSMGADVESVNMAWLTEAARANGLMTPADGAAYHHERMNTTPEVYGEDVLRRLRMGASYTSTEYALARRTQAEMKRRMMQFFEKYDLLILPSTAVTAPPIEGPDAVEQAKLLTRFTAPFNLTGLPALSIPCGLDNKGLPVGLQIVGPAWRERWVLKAGYTYEQATLYTFS